MAEYILDVLSQTSKLDWAFPFQRTGSFPIDRSAMFSSLADAQNYALGVAEGEEAKDERKLGGTSYVGQIISVYEAAVEADEENGIAAVPASVNAYIITPTRGLMKLAATTASGDIVADVVDLQGKVNNLLSQIESLQGEVDKKADSEQVAEDIASAIEPLAKQADVYKKTETYSKSEVETYVQSQIGSVGHLKREIVEALPAVDDADADTIYMLKKVGGLLDNDHYEEYMVINGAWEMIGDTYVDLSNYATKTYVDGEIDKVEEALTDKADQSALDETNEALAAKAEKQYVDEELAKKANQEDLETLQESVNNKADKATTLEGYGITDAYTKQEVNEALLLKASQQDHNELVDQVNNKADKSTTLEGYGITDAYTKDQVYSKEEVYSKEDADKAMDDKIAQSNAIESITIEGEAIAPVEKAVALPLALSSKAGLVKSAAITDGKTADNSVSVDTNGYMFVNSVNVNKLVQTNGEYLILNGGAATV